MHSIHYNSGFPIGAKFFTSAVKEKKLKFWTFFFSNFSVNFFLLNNRHTSAMAVRAPHTLNLSDPSEAPTLLIGNETVKIGSRRSKLAVIQSEIVGETINKYYPDLKTPVTKVSTLGDQVQNRPLYSFGGKAVWTKELEVLLLDNVGDTEKIDLIAHSLKDMPTLLPDEFELGCILPREDPRDALVMPVHSPYKELGELPAGSIVGTSSVRRSAQLHRRYPHLKFKSVRGNLQTRLRKLDAEDSEYSCIILAAAGLLRVGQGERITKYLNEDEMYYAVGQGAIGVEIRKGDLVMRRLCEVIGCQETTWRCIAERSLLRTLEGGCSVPVGVSTKVEGKILHMKAVVLSVSGDAAVEGELSMEINENQDGVKLGLNLANFLIEKGAKKILDEINFEKINEIKNNGIIN